MAAAAAAKARGSSAAPPRASSSAAKATDAAGLAEIRRRSRVRSYRVISGSSCTPSIRTTHAAAAATRPEPRAEAAQTRATSGNSATEACAVARSPAHAPHARTPSPDGPTSADATGVPLARQDWCQASSPWTVWDRGWRLVPQIRILPIRCGWAYWQWQTVLTRSGSGAARPRASAAHGVARLA